MTNKPYIMPFALQLPYEELGALREFLKSRGGRLLEEVDLHRAAEILSLDYFGARRLIVDQRLIPYRRKTKTPKSPVLVKISDLEAYKEAMTIRPKPPRKKRGLGYTLTPADIMMGGADK